MSPVEYKKCDDDALVRMMKQNDQLAFREIYDRYSMELFKSVYNGLHKKEESKEIIQDVFLYLWSKRETIQITASLKGYLFIAARHAMLNAIRSEKMRKAYAMDLYLFASTLQDNTTLEWQDFRDLEAAVEHSLGQLPEKVQTIFRLSRKENLPIPRIAEQLNIATKTVENNISIALNHLRESLGNYMVSVVAMFAISRLLFF